MQTLTGQIKKINRLSGQLTTPRAAPGGSEFKDVDIDVLSEQFSESLPMTFTTTADALEDYCIYGNTGGVGDPVNKLTITLQDGTTRNGVTATVNNGTIVLNGTTTATSFFVVQDHVDYAAGDRLIGCPAGGGLAGYVLRCTGQNGLAPYFIDTGSGVIIDQTITDGAVGIRVSAGVTCSNLTFKPVLYSDCPLPISVMSADEPSSNETVTINLDFPLYYDDVITMSDAGVTIPTVIGSNYLTVGTTVQPAAVQVKYQN